MTEADREFHDVLGVLIAEREPRDGTKLDAASIAVLRQAAKLMVSDNPRDAKDVAELLKLAPSPVRRVTVEKTMEELEASEPDLSALDDADLEAAERLSALLHGLACPIPDKRRAVALQLVRVLPNGPDGQGGVDDLDGLLPGPRRDLIEAVRRFVVELLAPLSPSEVFALAPAPAAEPARGAAVADLEEQIEWLRARLAEAEAKASGKLVDLAVRRRG
jgi:hypothetical protein